MVRKKQGLFMDRLYGRTQASVRNKGFTIIELIIAISIIGILAVIVSVSYAGLDDRAIESTIKSDLSNALGELNLLKLRK